VSFESAPPTPPHNPEKQKRWVVYAYVLEPIYKDGELRLEPRKRELAPTYIDQDDSEGRKHACEKVVARLIKRGDDVSAGGARIVAEPEEGGVV
jgi:hypothetical protein